jgi:hypothetical protein
MLVLMLLLLLLPLPLSRILVLVLMSAPELALVTLLFVFVLLIIGPALFHAPRRCFPSSQCISCMGFREVTPNRHPRLEWQMTSIHLALPKLPATECFRDRHSCIRLHHRMQRTPKASKSLDVLRHLYMFRMNMITDPMSLLVDVTAPRMMTLEL